MVCYSENFVKNWYVIGDSEVVFFIIYMQYCEFSHHVWTIFDVWEQKHYSCCDRKNYNSKYVILVNMEIYFCILFLFSVTKLEVSSTSYTQNDSICQLTRCTIGEYTYYFAEWSITYLASVQTVNKIINVL